MPALDASGLKSVLARFRRHLREHREDLNRLNVYPIPDGDTGTNLILTMDAVLAEIDRSSGLDGVCDAMTHGSLMGARGNSGVILAQILAALAAEFRSGVDADRLAAGLDRAVGSAYAAVGEPVEGTILTVLTDAARAAGTAGSANDDLAGAASRVYEAAEASVRSTPRLLPELAAAGVVDAGGAGLLGFFAALAEETGARTIDLPGDLFRSGSPAAATRSYPRFEVMLLVGGGPEAVAALKEAWSRIGDSVAVVGDEGLYSAHVHTDDSQAAIEAAGRAGSVTRVRIRDLRVESGHEEFHAAAPFTPLDEVVTAPVGVVAVAAGGGIVEMFRFLGAQGIVDGGRTMNPSVGELIEAVEAVPAPHVILLPDDPDAIPAAARAAGRSHKPVTVVGTRTQLAGLAAMRTYDPESVDPGAVAVAMESAASELRGGALARVEWPAVTPLGSVHEGDWIGSVDGEPRLVAGSAAEGLVRLVEMLAGPPTDGVTIILGEGAAHDAAAAVAEWAAVHLPEADLQVVDGGQPVHAYLVALT